MFLAQFPTLDRPRKDFKPVSQQKPSRISDIRKIAVFIVRDEDENGNSNGDGDGDIDEVVNFCQVESEFQGFSKVTQVHRLI